MSTMSAMKGRMTTQGHHGTPHAVWPQAPRVRSGANQLEKNGGGADGSRLERLQR